MAKYSADHLKAMIREVVRQEIREVVSGVIAEVLSERYLRQLAESAAASRPRGVSDLTIQGDDEPEEDYVPRPLSNSILGVGQEDPVFKKEPKSTKVRQFSEDQERNEMLSLFFEGTKSIDQVEAEAPSLEEVVAPKMSKALQEKATIWKSLSEGMIQDAVKKKVQVDPAAEEARIKRLREQLDVKVGG